MGGVLLHQLCIQWSFGANISLDLETVVAV